MCFECHKRKKKPTFTEEKACAVCGKGFIPRSANHAFCSEGCFAMRFGTATCPTCGKGFVRVRKGQMHCSNECAFEARHEASKRPCPVCGRIMSYREDKKNAFCSKECMYHAHGTIRTCLQCGREFHAVKTNQGKGKYCSRECQFKAQIRRPMAVCRQCGKEYRVGRESKGVYCSHECQRASMRKERKPCAYCGRDHMADEGEYCSKRCEKAAYREGFGGQFDDMVEWMGWLSKTFRIEKECELCGDMFRARRDNTRWCPQCRRYLRNRHHELRIYRNGKPDLSITLWKVYQRDKGYCRRCGLRLSFDHDPNDDEYPSIDHIVPLAKGGLHRWDNVQLMCRGCNSLKCDEEPAVRERSFQTRLAVDG